MPCCMIYEPAQVTFENPHILLLDEPSNHLDLDAVKALIKVDTLLYHTVGVNMVSSLRHCA